MLFSPAVFVLFTIVALSLWFLRSKKRDAALWMYSTYAGVFGLAYAHYASFTSFDVALPTVVRDFLLIGVAGLLQSLAVAKRITILQAIVGIGVIYALVHLLPFQGDEQGLASEQDLATSLVKKDQLADGITADPNGEFLIEKRPETSEKQLQDWAAANGFTVSRAFEMKDENSTLLDDYYVLDVPNNKGVNRADIEAANLTVWVEENEVVSLNLPDNQPEIQRTDIPMVNDAEAEKQWAMEVLNMREYYQLLKGLKARKKVKIAILDTGVDGQHEDLKANYFSLKKQYDNDPRGHGTHCAGIAAGVTNNGIGIASLAGDGNLVEITSIKVLSAGGAGSQKTIIQGMLEAADSGVDIISMSLGGFSNRSRQRAYNQAISYARRNNVIVIAAAGNSNREASEYAPANGAGAICVAATDQLNLRAPFSNRVGKIKMAVAAPGVNIHSTYPDNRYKMFSGTSMACPFVAGLVAVMRSQKPDLTNKEAYKILHDTGLKTSEEAQLGRIVQPAAALRAVMN